MYPILLNFGAMSVHAYGFFIAVAFLAGIAVTLHYAKREGIDSQNVLDIAIIGLVAAIVGARLFYVVGQWSEFRDNPMDMFMVQKGGLVFLGGFLLALLAGTIYVRFKKLPLLKFFDSIAPGVALGYSIARIGCFLNGCCFGLPTKLPWGIAFPPGALAFGYFGGDHLHPTQLYALLLMLLSFLLLVVIYRSKRFDGQVFFWWFIFYALYRFGVEFLRYSPIHWLGLTPSQWIVIPAFIFGVWGLNHYKPKPGA